MTRIRLLSLIGLSILTTRAEGALLCANKKGAVFFRTGTCKGKETQVSPDVAGLRGPQGPPGPRGKDSEKGEDADMTKLPIAFGVIGADGSVTTATDNVDATFDSGAAAYIITIDEVSFSFHTYAAVVSDPDLCEATGCRSARPFT